MSQFGMQMPAARARRSASPDVYTILAVTATVFLIVACVILFQAGSKVGPNGSAFSLQKAGQIQLQTSPER